MGRDGGAGRRGARASRRHWIDLSLNAKGRLVLALPLATLVLTCAGLLVSVAQTRASIRGVTHAREVTAALGDAYNMVLDGETGIRGYLVAGDRRFLEPATRARKELPVAMDRITALFAGDRTQAVRIGSIRAELARGYQWRSPSMPAPDAAPARINAWLVQQKASSDRIRGAFATMYFAEEERLAASAARRDAWARGAQVAAGTAFVLGLVGGLLAMAGFTVGIARRLGHLREETDRLLAGEEVGAADPGRDEIGVLSRRMIEVISCWRESEAEARAARAAAEAANEAKSEFLSRMSHELRTPLNAVLGFAQLLEMDLPEDQQEGVHQIRRAGQHLLDLINEVLDISRIESGQLDLSPEAVLVSELLDETVALMRPMAAARALSVEITQVTCGCHAQADRRRLKQVLLNLLSNAVKYNRSGGAVRIRCSQPDHATVLIEVEDTGIGIPAADLARLFVPFERLAAAGSDVEGTGVGLALSQRLTQAMGGHIEVSSEVGRGSIFSLSLPASGPPGAVTQPLPALIKPRVGEPPSKTRTLLSVEDNHANARLLEQIVLRRPAWRIVHAGLGQLGLDLATAAPPDLVLLDLHLPDMAGQEVLRRLQATPETAHVPVVVLTADATAGVAERLRYLGAQGYLTKPIDVEAVLDLLDQIAAPAHPADRR